MLTQMTKEDWKTLKYFDKSEFDCKHTGNNQMKLEFMHKMEQLREAVDRPLIITSGYRDRTHPVEAKKVLIGKHNQGIAADIKAVGGVERYELVSMAIALGFTGIGIAKNFIHLDIRDDVPVIWSY